MKSFKKSRKAPGLMLTPLLDMFTIILIFLIVSFNAEDYDFKLDDKVVLPESTARSQFKPSINVSITKTGVTIEQEAVLPLVAGRADAALYASGEAQAIVGLLNKYYDGLQEDPEAAPDPDDTEDSDDPEAAKAPSNEFVLTIQADESLEYDTLYLVLRSAAKAGFFKYRLAVLRN